MHLEKAAIEDYLLQETDDLRNYNPVILLLSQRQCIQLSLLFHYLRESALRCERFKLEKARKIAAISRHNYISTLQVHSSKAQSW